MSPFLDQWLEDGRPDEEEPPPNPRVFRERDGGREAVASALREAVLDHLIDLDVLSRLGYSQAQSVLQGRLPTRKRARSGDLGEIIGSVFVEEFTSYRLPIKRLRYKDDRDLSLRGDDLIAVRGDGESVAVLKGEAKSAISLNRSTVETAVNQLGSHSGRPNPSWLTFIWLRLTELRRDEDAGLFLSLIEGEIAKDQMEHLLFTLCGNDPTELLKEPPEGDVPRLAVGVIVSDHGEFIRNLFEGVHADTS